MGIFYNIRPIRTKDLKYLDIINESINNPIRFFLGYYTLADYFDFSSMQNIQIILFYFSFGCFLMSCKRLSEKRYFGNSKNIAKYRITIFRYTENQLILQTFFYSIISLLFISNLLIVKNFYFFIFIFTLVLTYIEYINLALNKSYSSQEPETLYKEKLLVFLIILNLSIFFYIIKNFTLTNL